MTAITESPYAKEAEQANSDKPLVPTVDDLAQPFPPEPLLLLNTCIVRPYHASDVASLSHHADNKSIAQWMTDRFPSPYTLEASSGWVKTCLDNDAKGERLNFVIADIKTNQAIGGIGLKPGTDIYHRTIEFGYWLGEGYWGKGIMTGVLRSFVDYLFEGKMKGREEVNKLAGRATGRNEGSNKVFLKVGFTLEGTLRENIHKWGKLEDECVWGLTKSEWEERRQRTCDEWEQRMSSL